MTYTETSFTFICCLFSGEAVGMPTSSNATDTSGFFFEAEEEDLCGVALAACTSPPDLPYSNCW